MLLMMQAAMGRTMHYTVKSLGISIASLSIMREANPAKLVVKTKSIYTSSIFPELDNVYTVFYNDSYLPSFYHRKVNQDKYQDQVSTTYSHVQKKASQSQSRNSSTITYAINSNTRDFFSLVAMISDGKAGAGTFELDANGSLWSAKVSSLGSKKLKTPAGSYESKGYKISVSCATHSKPPYADMITHNLFHKNSEVELWVDGNGLLVKASIKKGLASSYWELQKISP